jgi:hypothetical protein
VLHSWQFDAVSKHDLHFQSHGVQRSSKVLKLQVVKHVGLEASQKGQEVVDPRGEHIVVIEGLWDAPQNMEDCSLTNLITPLKL